MKSLILLFSTLCLLIISLTLRAEEMGASASKPIGNTSTSQRSTVPSASIENTPQLSLKCAISSGICKMVTPAEVGSYCVCNTPSGPTFGVVIP